MRSNIGFGASGTNPPTFDPTTIFGLQWWLDATDTASFSFSSGSVVSQWRDKSANARHLTPVTNPPSRIGSINGKLAVEFTPPAQHMMTAAASSIGTPMTVFWVARNYLPLAANGGRILTHRSTAAWETIHSDGIVGRRTGLLYCGTALVPGPADTIATSDPHTVIAFQNGTTSVVSVDSFPNTAANAGTGTLSLGTLGARFDGSNPLTGAIGEVLIWNTNLSTFDRQRVEIYLRYKWKIS